MQSHTESFAVHVSCLVPLSGQPVKQHPRKFSAKVSVTSIVSLRTIVPNHHQLSKSQDSHNTVLIYKFALNQTGTLKCFQWSGRAGYKAAVMPAVMHASNFQTHLARYPPSTLRVVPVMKLASLDSRKATAAATSSGLPSLQATHATHAAHHLGTAHI